MLRRWNGSAWQDASFLRRWNGSAWQDSSMKRWNGNAWQVVYPSELILYNSGDQKIDITGGWTRKVDSWAKYMGTSGDEYISYTDYNNTTSEKYMEVRVSDWGGNKLPATVNPVDLTSYSSININFDIFIHQQSAYSNGMNWGVVAGPMTYWYDTNNPPQTICNGYPYRIERAIELRQQSNHVWQTGKTHSINVSDLTGSWYVLICPWSWSMYDDYTILRIRKVWLS